VIVRVNDTRVSLVSELVEVWRLFPVPAHADGTSWDDLAIKRQPTPWTQERRGSVPVTFQLSPGDMQPVTRRRCCELPGLASHWGKVIETSLTGAPRGY
jgi:hypothetical protein